MRGYALPRVLSAGHICSRNTRFLIWVFGSPPCLSSDSPAAAPSALRQPAQPEQQTGRTRTEHTLFTSRLSHLSLFHTYHHQVLCIPASLHLSVSRLTATAPLSPFVSRQLFHSAERARRIGGGSRGMPPLCCAGLRRAADLAEPTRQQRLTGLRLTRLALEFQRQTIR